MPLACPVTPGVVKMFVRFACPGQPLGWPCISSIAFVTFEAMFAPVARQAIDGPLVVVPDALVPDALAPDALVPDWVALPPDALEPVVATDPELPVPTGKGSSPVHDEATATIPSATKGAQPSR